MAAKGGWLTIVVTLAGCLGTGRVASVPQPAPESIAARPHITECVDEPGDEESQVNPASFEVMKPQPPDEAGFDWELADADWARAVEDWDRAHAPLDAPGASVVEAPPDALDPRLDETVPEMSPFPEQVELESVIASVYQSYPLLESALYSRTIADGEHLAAEGGFDLKLVGASENGPVGFYETYRQTIGFVQPMYQGGDVFGGYRIGRGNFEPWYLERQTNEGGEFKLGVAVPLARNREIDARRAGLWRTSYGRQLVEPEIHAQLIGFVQAASDIYWDWIAAGEKHHIARRVLELAEERTERIRRQVEEGLLDPPELTDNLRLVAERRAKMSDADRKLQQSAVKLSLYYRDFDGQPRIPGPEMLRPFPDPMPITPEEVLVDSQLALEQRPEIDVLNLIQRQLEVDYSEANNDLRPALDAVVSGSQDVGFPTSKKNDKGPFELNASVFLEVPAQRRKARGKLQSVQGKLAQLHAKRRMTEDKIVADVQSAYAGLMSAFEQVQQSRQAVEYAEDLARRERRNFDEGASDLLKVTLREQYAAESAEKVVDALRLYYQARAEYRAALAQDQLPPAPVPQDRL